MMTLNEARKAAMSFDYSKLEFYDNTPNPVFIDLRTGEIDTWSPGTDPDIAELQNPVKFLGTLSPAEAKKGVKPYTSDTNPDMLGRY